MDFGTCFLTVIGKDKNNTFSERHAMNGQDIGKKIHFPLLFHNVGLASFAGSVVLPLD